MEITEHDEDNKRRRCLCKYSKLIIVLEENDNKYLTYIAICRFYISDTKIYIIYISYMNE